MDKFGVLLGCNTDSAESVALAAKICTLLRADGIAPFVAQSDSAISAQIGADVTESPEKCRFVVTVGGDGTLLKWGKHAAVHSLPLLGVNTGRLGFMATLEPCDIAEIPRILQGGYTVSRRMMMRVLIERADGTIEEKTAINDVVIERDRSSKLPEFSIFCGSSEASKIHSDGVILSTPTGSTAYSLSAGGPIIAPDMECIEFTALCPHTLFMRPMIFSAQQTVSVKYTAYQNSSVTVAVDGEHGIPFGDGDILRLSKSAMVLEIIEAGEGFYGSVANKLMRPLK